MNPVLIAAMLLIPIVEAPSARVVAARPSAWELPIPRKSLASVADRLLDDPALAGGWTAVVIRSLTTGETLVSRNPDQRCIPASNQKLITAAAALSLLGPDFRFTTQVRHQGNRLWLVGSGDPSLDTTRLGGLARQSLAALRSEAPAEIELDDSAFAGPNLGAAWQWDDESFAFSAPFSALVVDRSTARLRVTPGSPGMPATVSTEPPIFSIEGTVGTVEGNRSDFRWERDRGTGRLRVSGTIGASSPIQELAFAVADPTATTGAHFQIAAREAGWPLGVAGRGAAPINSRPIAVSHSKPMSQLLADFLKPSDNLMGECLLRAIGSQGGGVGSDRTGLSRVEKWFDRIGLAHHGVDIRDGSGLSMHNTVTARFLSDLLSKMANNRVFRDALPIAGRDGTLRSRLKGTVAEGRVQAKTGTLTVASTLSGYATTTGGEEIVFSILMNQFDRSTGSRRAREIQDALCLAITRVAPPSATPRPIPGEPSLSRTR